MPKLDKRVTETDKKQAGVLLQIVCVIALIVYLYLSYKSNSDPNYFVVAIFGGGILGTENLLKLIGRDKDTK